MGSAVLSQAWHALSLTSEVVTLVLEEDGTVVENEEFFQSLETNTQFMVLEEGQRWTQAKVFQDLSVSCNHLFMLSYCTVNLMFHSMKPKQQ